VPGFNDLHSRKHEEEVQLYPFHCRALEGEDLRELPLSIRKVNLARLLARRPDGISVADFEHGEIGPDLFRKACEFGLEGIVWKRSDLPTAPADRRTRSRSKTGRIRRCAEKCSGMIETGAAARIWQSVPGVVVDLLPIQAGRPFSSGTGTAYVPSS
jgi:hypothetical protein